MSAETVVTIIFGVISLCLTLVGCTWKLCEKLNKLVTHVQCAERRANCPCVIDIKNIKERID